MKNADGVVRAGVYRDGRVQAARINPDFAKCEIWDKVPVGVETPPPPLDHASNWICRMMLYLFNFSDARENRRIEFVENSWVILFRVKP